MWTHNVLFQFPVPDSSVLKQSKIGKAVMLLYRHPKETRKNREKAGKIISKFFSRTIVVYYSFPDQIVCTILLQMSGLDQYLVWPQISSP